MERQYSVSGMTCSGCANTVKKTLERVPDVSNVQIDLEHGTANIIMTQHVPLENLQESLMSFPSYKISEAK